MYTVTVLLNDSNRLCTISELNKLVGRLDQRAGRASVALNGVIQAKPRIDSMVSTLPPPTNAPGWAVDSSLIEDVPRQSQTSTLEDPGLTTTQITPRGAITEESSVRRRLINDEEVLGMLAFSDTDQSDFEPN